MKALTELEDFDEYFNCQYNEADIDTIGGVVLQKFGHMPKKNEKVMVNGFEFKVVSADKRRIQVLQLTIPKEHVINGKPTD